MKLGLIRSIAFHQKFLVLIKYHHTLISYSDKDHFGMQSAPVKETGLKKAPLGKNVIQIANISLVSVSV